MSRHHRRHRQLVTHDEHPRKRLLANGAQSLSDAELVEILLRNGSRGSRAWELARELIREFGGLVGLVNVEPAYLQRHDVSEPKAAIVVAAFEIACRVAKARVPPRDLLDQPAIVASYLALRYGDSDQETMGALFLNVRNRLIGECDIFRGTQDRTAVDPRAILKEALLRSASRIVLFHTHPSGDPSPSREDVSFTRRLAKASDLLGIRLLDHLILGGNGRWVSMQRRGAW